MEDIIEDLVGEIQDEYDLLPTHCVKAGAGWVVGGGVTPAKLRDVTGIELGGDLPKEGARNLDAWVAGHLGRAVKPGDTLERGNVRVAVRKVRRQLLLEAQVHAR
jgi:putative hemolysin